MCCVSSHSLARLITELRVFIVVIVLSLKTSLFLLTHNVHSIQGVKDPFAIQVGGAQRLVLIISQATSNSDQLPDSILLSKGAALQTCWEKLHCNRRWIIVSVSPHRLHRGSTGMWLAASLSSTGRALFAIFQRKVFHPHIRDPIEFCCASQVLLCFLVLHCSEIASFVVYDLIVFPSQTSLSGAPSLLGLMFKISAS